MRMALYAFYCTDKKQKMFLLLTHKTINLKTLRETKHFQIKKRRLSLYTLG